MTPVHSNPIKHAFLLIIHDYSEILETLIRLIDNEQNDIFIHIDRKTRQDLRQRILVLAHHSKICFVKRKKVYWGHISLVQAEYLLFEAAKSNGPYLYYHLLSGNDLPIKSQNEIHEFFSEHKGLEFIGFSDNKMEDRMLYYWPFPRHLRGLCSNQKYIYRKINKLQSLITTWFLSFQKKNGIKNRCFPSYWKGSEWVSLTDSAVAILLRYKCKILRCFRFANCPDEHYKQTILSLEAQNGAPIHFATYGMVTSDPGTISGDIPYDARLIDWSDGYLHDFTLDDWMRIMKSRAMFCRKIKDPALANKLFLHLTSVT